MRFLPLSIVALTLSHSIAGEPEIRDPGFELTLFAAEPDIVTPIGAVFDKSGRFLVIESHTHFRPGDYDGPPADRIRIVEDANGDGKADKFTTYFEGLTHAMSLAQGPDASIYVATRAKILKLRDADNDGVADKDGALEIARLETEGNYPHNGLCGLAFDSAGRLWFGLGENLGKPYKLIGADGTTLAGGGEGGNIYRCSADGSGLRRIATGFWNPFGICFDPNGRVFTVDNDPDATPYCRLLHVVPGGDYGYQFRYGRSGKHPLQAWEAELPGTLPMVASTGEAPCAVIPFEGRLWVTSCWHNRIERFALQQEGASWKSKLEIVVQGDQWFRPVAFASSPDGSLFITDWGHASYPLHGKGRIWRLARKKGTRPDAALRFPDLNAQERSAAKLHERLDFDALGTDDRFLWQAAVWGIVENPPASEIAWSAHHDPRVRLGILAAIRWSGSDRHEDLLEDALKDSDSNVLIAAIRWAADEKLNQHLGAIEKIGNDAEKGSRLAKVAAAAAKHLN